MAAILTAYMLGKQAVVTPPEASHVNPAQQPTSPIVAHKPSSALSESADFSITDRLLADPPSSQELDGPLGVSTCLGGELQVANVSHANIGLQDTPNESDDTIDLGILKPGGVFRLKPKQLGVFFLSRESRSRRFSVSV